MTDVRQVIQIDDSDAARAFDAMQDGYKRAADANDQYEKKASDTSRKIVEGLRNQEKAIIDATQAESRYIEEIIRQEKEIRKLKEAQQEQKLTLDVLRKEYAKLGDQGTAEAKKLKDQIDNLNASLSNTQDQLKRVEKENQSTLKSFNNLGSESDKIGMSFGKTAKQGGLLNKAAGFLKGGLAGLVAGAVALIGAGLVAFFNRSQEGAEFLAGKIGFLEGVLKELGNRLFLVGEALFGWITGTKDFSDVTNAASDAVSGLGGALLEAGQAGESYAITLDRIRKAQEAFIVEEAKGLKQAEERRRIADDDRRSTSERIAALRQAAAIEADLERQRLANARQNVEIAREAATVGDGQLNQTAELIAAEKELIDVQRDAADRQFQDEQAILALQREGIQLARQRQEALDDLAKRAQAVRDRLRDLQNGDVQGIEKIRLDAIKATEDVNELEAQLRKLYEERRVAFDLEEDFDAIRTEIRNRQAREENAFRIKQLREEERNIQRAADQRREAALSELDQREELALLLADTNRRVGLTETDRERATVREKLNIQRDFAAQRLKIAEETFGPTSVEANLIRAQIELIQQEIEGLADTDLSALEDFRNKLFDALGLNESNVAQIGSLFQDAIGGIVDIIQFGVDSQIAEVDRLIQAREESVQDLESRLEEERRLQEQGFANDAGALEQKLQREQQILAEAEAKKLELEKRSARQRLAIEAAQRTSSYLTTVFNLLAAESRLGVVGIIAVAAGGLALLGSIIAQANAASEQFDVPTFRHGTDYVEGSGTGTSDSVMARLSVGERVLPYELNQKLGGRHMSNEEVVRYFHIGKATEAAQFTEPDSRAEAAIAHGHRVSEMAETARIRAIENALRNATRSSTEEMITYWKSRPVVIPTKNVTQVTYEKGGVKFNKKIKHME